MQSTLPIYTKSTRHALDRVLRDLKLLASDAEVLLNSTKEDARATVVEARERLGTSIDQAKKSYAELQRRATASIKAAAEETDETIRANPYESIGLALGVGVLLGLVIRTK